MGERERKRGFRDSGRERKKEREGLERVGERERKRGFSHSGR